MRTYEDLVEDPESSGDDYFDGEEFALRAEIEASQYWHVHRRRVLLQTLRSVSLPDDARLVELGCGIGTVATHLNAGGLHVDYGDVFGSALEIAARRAQEELGDLASQRRFMRIDVTQPLPLSGYDGILMFDVLEHLPDDEAVLQNVHAALPSGGLLMLTVPAFQFLWSPWDDIEKHKRRYTRANLSALLERTGFEVERATYFFLPLFFAASAVKGLRAVRNLVAPPGPADDITQLAEAQGGPVLNRVMLGVLATERPWLSQLPLPLGTSVMAIARKR
jgi:2-polyprenyl-3-methyl-5-hydroxy-6-metoxy-1,4-benzoquinol methylase